MAVRKPGSPRSGSKRNQARRHQLLQRKQRKLHLENLEPRRLLAQGPQLISVRPNDGDFLNEGDTLHNDLVDVTFIFSDSQQINDATLDAISLTGSGADDVFDTEDDVVIEPGYVGIGDQENRVVMRFAEKLPDDDYRIDILGTGDAPLENLDGEPFNDGDSDFQLQFQLDLGAQVAGVVPQPISRDGGVLTQARDQIDVYFNDDDLNAADAENPDFYQLILTNDTVDNQDDLSFHPDSVTYDAASDKAVLTFSNDLNQLPDGSGGVVGNATWRLKIGVNEVLPAPPAAQNPGDAGGSFDNAIDLNELTDSLLISGEIVSTSPSLFDFPGGPDEPGHRDVPDEIDHHWGQHVNPDFGPDSTVGVQQVYYNFQSAVGESAAGDPILNLITDKQKQRVREAITMWSDRLGLQFLESADQGVTFATADPAALDPFAPDVVNYVKKTTQDLGFIARIDPDFEDSMVVLDAGRQWESNFGEAYYDALMTAMGFVLGLERAADLPPSTTMSFGPDAFTVEGAPPAEDLAPGNHDVVHAQYLHKPDSNDIDLYKFTVDLGDAAQEQKESSTLVVETFAERQPNASLLDTLVTVFQETETLDGTGAVIGTQREIIARNDDYYSEDSYIELTVGTGTYYVQVTSTGNGSTLPEHEESGYGGTTEGKYQLRLDLRSNLSSDEVLSDATGTALDGDGDGTPGGAYNFWFRSVDEAETVIVDKAHSPDPGQPLGTLANPFDNIADALDATASGNVVRVVPNAGSDGDLATLDDNFAYEVGLGTLPGQILSDGSTLEVPAGVTVMVDPGTIFKLRKARVGVGSSNLNTDRSGGALQVLGTPANSVYFTSWMAEDIGLDTHAPSTSPQEGDWGGIRFRNDLDNAEARFNYEQEGIFLNYVNGAEITYGGGRLNVNSVEQTVQPIQMIQSRPTITNNVITLSAAAALSADPNSFEETNFHAPKFQLFSSFTSDYQRVGPDIYNNRLVDNTTNGLFISIETPAGDELQELTVSARFDDSSVVHTLAENLRIAGTPGGPLLDASQPPVELVSLQGQSGGSLTEDDYNYKVVFLDDNGFESRPSEATATISLAAGEGTISLDQLPPASESYVGRRLYRSAAGGVGPYTFVKDLTAAETSVDDDGTLGDVSRELTSETELGVIRARTDARLRLDPGLIVKLEGSLIEASFGSQLIVEGRADRDVVITSTFDDRFGGSGAFDTQKDGLTAGAPGDWAGIFLGQNATASIDYAHLTFAGGDTRIEGSFVHFNVLEVHQADLRLAHTLIEHNDDGVEDIYNVDPDRVGRETNVPATILVRGGQPVLLDNVIRDNAAQALTIGIDSFTHHIRDDLGRSTGHVGLLGAYTPQNRGPLVRGNVIVNNPNNGMNIRGGILTDQVVFDDIGINHVLFEDLIVPNFHTFGGLRMESSPDASLVVKFGGPADPFSPHVNCSTLDQPDVQNLDALNEYQRAFALADNQTVERIIHPDGHVECVVSNSTITGLDSYVPTSGITAMGTALDIEDRIGGMVHVIGHPNFPVILTSIHDDRHGNGFTLEGDIQRDVLNDGVDRVPQPGDWTGIRLAERSHDRNVDIVLERESRGAVAPGVNAEPDNAEFLGELAADEKSGDDNLRLGFEIQGLLNGPTDEDIYSFTAEAGTEVWLDIDRTSNSLDTMVELIDSTGATLAASDDSDTESISGLVDFAVPGQQANPLQKAANEYQPKHSSGALKDFFSQNQYDAGMRVVLPGVAGTRNTYHVRVRSFEATTEGAYQLQVRLGERDEFPGSTVRNAEIYYAMNGIDVTGLPLHSPLVGEAAENESLGAANNNQLAPDFNVFNAVPSTGPQDLGNLLQSDRAAISVAGELDLPQDIDFYEVEVSFAHASNGGNPGFEQIAAIFDIDYADGLARANTNLAVYDEWGRLVYFAEDSNVFDDRLPPLAGGDTADLSTGSVGSRDPFVGPVSLPEGTYFVAVASNARIPQQLLNNPALRREPISSVTRLVEDHLGDPGFETASAPGISNFVSDPSHIVPLDADDVTLYVLQDQRSATDVMELVAIDPETGKPRWNEVRNYAGLLQDIDTRRDVGGGIYGFSTPANGLEAQGVSDDSVGLLRGVRTQENQFVGGGDDGILTFQSDPEDPEGVVASDAGVFFHANAFGTLAETEVLFAVGERGDSDTLSAAWPLAANLTNLLYLFNPETGEALSDPLEDREGSVELNDGGPATNVRERGQLDPNVSTGTSQAERGPGGTITGLQILGGVLYASTDTGGLYRVNDPTGAASLEYLQDLLPNDYDNVADDLEAVVVDKPESAPGAGDADSWDEYDFTTPIFGLVASTPGATRSLDAEIWTKRENAFIPSSTSLEHITVFGTGDGANTDSFTFSVTEANSQIIIDVDTEPFANNDPATNLRFSLTGPGTNIIVDDSPVGSGGSGKGSADNGATTLDPFLDTTGNVGTYTLTITNATGVPIPANSNYLAHISVANRDDTATGAVVARDFEGLASRPAQISGDAFFGLLYAVDTLGDVYAFDSNNSFQNTDKITVAQTSATTNAAQHARGIAFSQTVAHHTDKRHADHGHGMSEAVDDSRARGPIYFDEVEPNDNFGTPQNLENERWTLGFDSNIASDDTLDVDINLHTSAIVPHVTIVGRGDGSILDGTATRDFYSFEVTEPNSYVQIETDFSFDYQLRHNGGQPGNDPDDGGAWATGVINSQLTLRNANGGTVASHSAPMDWRFGGGGCSQSVVLGSPSCSQIQTPNTHIAEDPNDSWESLIQTFIAEPGTYTVEVTKFDPETIANFQPPEAGDEYTLHVSVQNHAVDAGNETVDGGRSLAFGSTYGGLITDVRPNGVNIDFDSPFHGLVSGDQVYIEDVEGVRLANGTYQVTRVDFDTFRINAGNVDQLDTAPVYEGGGRWHQLFSPAQNTARVASSTFSLEGYAAEDKPVLYFNYLANLHTTDELDDFRVSLDDGSGNLVPLVVKVADGDEAVLDRATGTRADDNPDWAAQRDYWRAARVELGDFAGQSNLSLVFEYSTAGNEIADNGTATPQNFEGVQIDDVRIGFAERGEMITRAYSDPVYVPNPTAPSSEDEIHVGEYQLEIRRASDYGVVQKVGARGDSANSFQLTEAFDTNDRLAEQYTLLARAGADLSDGDTFTLSDGSQSVTFEYDSDDNHTLGNAVVSFTPTDTAEEVSNSIIASINGAGVQTTLEIQAGDGGGGRVHLYGNAIATGEIEYLAQSGSGDANRFRDQGQMLIHSNLIHDAAGWGINMVGGQSDSTDGAPVGFHAPQFTPVRNLQILNDEPLSGLIPGATIENNVLAGNGLGGIHVAGALSPWEIVPRRGLDYPDQLAGERAGDRVCDGSSFEIVAFGVTQRFEFEDISGEDLNACGSDVDGGNGWTPGSVPVFYRMSDGYLLLRGSGYTQTEMVYAIREAINSSILGTNTTSTQVEAIPYFSQTSGGYAAGADPALYLYNVEEVRGGPFRFSGRSQAGTPAQPFHRVINNTVYGDDGTESFYAGSGLAEPNDTAAEAVATFQGRANLPEKYITQGVIGDGLSVPSDISLDVDLFQVQMDIHDRLAVDVDANEFGSDLNSIVRVFNAQGEEVARNNDGAAPGEEASFDAYVEYVVTDAAGAGTYYVGISGRENSEYSALSLGGRSGPASRGEYTLEINVMASRNWAIESVPGTQIPDGSTITVTDRERTVIFEMDSQAAPGVAAGHVAIPYNNTAIGGARGPGYLAPEVAVVVADAIQAEFGDTLTATPLGGFRGATAGGPSANEPTNLDYNDQNFGHDYDPTRIGYGAVGTGVRATSEQFVYVEGASNITLADGSPFSMRPGAGDDNNVNGLMPEHGILVSEGASPTLLNNVLSNLAHGVHVAPSSASTIMGASLFQHTVVDHTGIDPLNESFNVTLDPDEPLFFNSGDQNFYPAAGSRVIDSSINSLEDRDSLTTVKDAVDIAPSPLLAPGRDGFGQLRVDDPNVDPPDGFGSNPFIDRGGVDRADFNGPTATLINPRDNDAEGADLDPTPTVVQMTGGELTHLSVQFTDGSNLNAVERGIGVDPSTITSDKITLVKNGQLLKEGDDYLYHFDPLGNTIRLTHISGYWEDESVYVIQLNNSDRFVFTAQDGSQFEDGDTMFIQDRADNTVTFEYDTGYSLHLAETLTLHIPAAGVADGDLLIVEPPAGIPVIFEYDSNDPSDVSGGRVRIDISQAGSIDDIAEATAQALDGAGIALAPKNLGDGRVHVGASTGLTVDTNFGALLQTGQAQPILDGDTFQISHGSETAVFSFADTWPTLGDSDLNDLVIEYSRADSTEDLANRIAGTIAAQNLGLTPTNQGDGQIHLGGEESHTVDAAGTAALRTTGTPGVSGSTQIHLPGQLSLVVPAQAINSEGGVADGQFFTIDDGQRDTSLRLAYPEPNNLDTAISITGNRNFNDVELVFVDSLIGGAAAATFDDINMLLTIDLEAAATTSGAIVQAINNEGTFTAELDVTRDATNDGGGIPGVVGSQGFFSSELRFEFEQEGLEEEDPAFGVSPGAVAIEFSPEATIDELADLLVEAISDANVDLDPVNRGNGVVELGVDEDHVVDATRTEVDTIGAFGGIADGETFQIGNLAGEDKIVTFEFNAEDDVAEGNVALDFNLGDSDDLLASRIIDAIVAADLDLTPTYLGNGSIALNDTPHHTADVGGSTMSQTGFPGGAVAIPFIPGASFDANQLASAIITAVNDSSLERISFTPRGGDTYFINGAAGVGGELDNFFVEAIADKADNPLLANQSSNETKFTILTDGVELDYGDAPNSPALQYETTFDDGGARHVVVAGTSLGQLVDAESDGLASPSADGDDQSDTDDEDGVGGLVRDLQAGTGIFNAHLATPITVTASRIGYLDAWIDFKGDGDWDDPGEQIFASQLLSVGDNELTVNTPDNASTGTTYARFRFSLTGNLTPSGVAAEGEVEDYEIEILPGTPPNAEADAFTTDEDTALGNDPARSLLDNDDDDDGDSIQVLSADAISELGATVDVDQNGEFNYDPIAAPALQGLAVGETIDDHFSYQIDDGNLPSLPATVTITVTGANDAPTANDGSWNADEDGDAVTAAVPADDIDSDDDQTTLTYELVVPPSEGNVTINTDGTFTFDPAGDFQDLAAGETRDVTFSYQATDSHGEESGLGTVTITVTGQNDAPLANDQTIFADEDGDPVGPTAFAGSDIDSDDDSSDLTYTIVDDLEAGEGSVVNNGDGTFTFDPGADFQELSEGVTGDVSFTYQATDTHDTDSEIDGTVTITVTGVNDAPVAVDNSYVTDEINVIQRNVINDDTGEGVDSDPDEQDVLTANELNGDSAAIGQAVVLASGATVTLESDGVLTYDPTTSTTISALSEGETFDDTFNYTITDGKGGTDSATVSVTTFGVNEAPDAVDDTYAVDEGALLSISDVNNGVLANDSDPEGDDLTLAIVDDVTRGTLTLNADGTFEYQHDGSEDPTDSFTYRISDPAGNADDATVTFNVSALNDAPIGADDFYTLDHGTTLNASDADGNQTTDANDDGTLVNDSDPEGDAITAVLDTGPQHASDFSLNADGTFTYTHDDSATTSDSFTYRAEDSSDASDLVTVHLTINPPPPPPWQNPTNRLDVNDDGFVSPIDVLLIVNFLNFDLEYFPFNLPLPTPTAEFGPPPYLDTNGDGYCTPIDPATVLAYLNQNQNNSGNAEADPAFAATWVDANQQAELTPSFAGLRSRTTAEVTNNSVTTANALRPVVTDSRSEAMQLRSAFNSPLDDAIAAFVAEVAEEQVDGADAIWQDEELLRLIRGR